MQIDYYNRIMQGGITMTLQQEYEQLKQQIGQYDAAGDYVGLAREMDRFLELTGQLYGMDSPEYAATLNDYGGIHRDIGNYEKAELAFLQAAEKIAALQSSQHADYGSVLNNLAGLYRLMKEYEKSELYFQKTLEIYKQALGDSGNDETMLRQAGLGIAMGNAPDFVKKWADAVTESNTQDGAAIAIERYVLC